MIREKYFLNVIQYFKTLPQYIIDMNFILLDNVIRIFYDHCYHSHTYSPFDQLNKLFIV